MDSRFGSQALLVVLRRSLFWYLAISFACFGRYAHAIDSQWLNAVTGQWNDAANWDTTLFPNNDGTDTYDVTIDATGAAYTVNLNQAVTINDLLIDSTDVTLSVNSGGSLELLGTATISSGNFFLLGGTIQGGTIDQSAGNLLTNSSSNNRLDGVTLLGDLVLGDFDSLRLRNGANFTGNADLAFSSRLGVETDTTFDNTTINIGRNATFGNDGTSTITLGANAQVNMNGSLGGGRLTSSVFTFGTGTVINQGTITSTGTAVTSFDRRDIINPGVFHNQGDVEVDAGRILQLNAQTTWNNTGTFRLNAPTATLHLSGNFTTAGLGQVDNSAGGKIEIATAFTGAAINQIDNSGGGQLDLRSSIDNTGNTITLAAPSNAVLGTLRLNGGVVTGGTIDQTAGPLRYAQNNNNRLNGVALLGNLDLGIGNSRVRLQNGTTFTGNVNIGFNSVVGVEDDATYDNKTIDMIRGGAQLNAESNSTLTLGPNTQVNMNPSVAAGNARIGSNLFTGGAGAVVNQGTISSFGTSTSFDRIDPVAFHNEGLVEILDSKTLELNGRSGWTNTGTYRLGTNTATLRVLNELTTAGMGTIDNAAGGKIQIVGSVTGAGVDAIDNSGGGQIEVQGSIDNTGSTITLDTTLGSVLINGGVISGGVIDQSVNSLLFNNNNNNRLDGATLQGDLNLPSDDKVRLQNGATITGDANVGQFSILAIEGNTTLDNKTITLAQNSLFGTSANGMLTLGSNAQVNLDGNNTTITGNLLVFGGNGRIVNQGTIRSSGAGGISRITPDNFDNQGVVEVNGGRVLEFPEAGDVTNHDGTTLTGGTWRAGAGSTLDFDEGNITVNAAEIILSGAGSSFTVTTSNTPLEAALVTNAGGGVLRLLDGRSYTATAGGSFENAGNVELAGGTFDAPMLDNQAGGDFFGFGTVTPAVANNGTVRAAGGTLTPTAGVQGTSGTVQVDADGILDLSTAVSTAGTLIHNGSAAASLNLGANDLVVSSDYNNANFGVGDAFDPRANVGGTGNILAAGDVAQTLVGDVSDGATANATLAFGNVHVGDVVNRDYRVHNTGTTGPALRGAVQPGANITDSQLSGTGVSSINFGPVSTGADSSNLTVTYTATNAGDIAAGQTVDVVNNFANVAGQSLTVTGTAYRFANPTDHTPEPIAFGNFHVGDAAPSQTLSLTNDVPNDGFSEALNAAFGSLAGGVTTNGGTFSLLAPGATESSSLAVGIDTATAGSKDGTAEITLASDGSGSSELGITPLASQTVNVTGSVFRFANPSAHSPEPVAFGNFHVGDAAPSQTLGLTNDVPNDGFSEGLNANVGLPTGGVTTNGGTFDLLAPGATDNSSLAVGIDTATAGQKNGTATISLESDGMGSSGLGVTPLASQTVNVTGSVFRFANPTAHTPEPVAFGNFHVGDAVPSQALSITNDVANDGFSESLNGSIGTPTGGVTTNAGTFGLLGPGATDNSSLSVGIDTASAGNKDGTAQITLASDGSGSSGLGITPLTSQTVNVTGSVFRFANPTAHSPEPVAFGNFHVGDAAPSQALSIINDVANDGFSESLNGSIGSPTGGVTTNSGGFNLLSPGATDNSNLAVGIDTLTAGNKSGTATISLASDGTGSSGLGVTNLASQTVNVTGSVFRLANPTAVTPEPIAFGDFHVGDAAPSQVLSLTNDVPNDGFSEALNATTGSPTGGVTTNSGSIATLMPGATDSTNLAVGIDTSTVGNKSGTATITLTSDGIGSSELGVTPLASQTVNVSGNVFRLAAPAIANPQPIDFGIVHVGDVITPIGINVENNAIADGFSENLNAAFSASTTGIVTNGTLNNLAAGSSDTNTLSLSIDTTSAGVRDGQATVAFDSDGDGINTLGQTSLGSVDILVTGTVNEFANAVLSKASGDGSFTASGTNEFTIDFGVIDLNAGDVLAEFELLNDVSDPADDLAGSWTLTADDFSLLGFGDFADLEAGDMLTNLQIGLSSAAAGAFSGSVTLSPLSENASGFSGSLNDITLLIEGIVSAPADFNEDGRVDGLDLSQWQSDYAIGAGSDADGDLDSDGADFLAWQRGFGTGVTSIAAASLTVPEPNTTVLFLLASLGLCVRRI